MEPSVHTCVRVCVCVAGPSHAEHRYVGLDSRFALGDQPCPACPLPSWWDAPRLHAPQTYLASQGVLCLKDAGDPGFNQIQADSCKKDHHDAGAVSQGQTETGVLGKGIPACPCAVITHGWCWPWGYVQAGEKRPLHMAAWAVQHVCVCKPGQDSASLGKGYVQIVAVLMDHRGMGTK